MVSCGIYVGNHSGDDDAETEAYAVEGSVTYGPVMDSLVEIYELNQDGTRGDLIHSTQTDENGLWSALVEYDGLVEVVSKGGSYVDEATGETITKSDDHETITVLHNLYSVVMLL